MWAATGEPLEMLLLLCCGLRRNLLRSARRVGDRQLSCQKTLPTREQQLRALAACQFDVLVIGGGAAGCGCALDAATRGLKTGLVETDDFASGASSKSTKLIDSGISYLQASLADRDTGYLHMLKQALKERATMLANAPHLARPLPMLVPIYSPLQLPAYWLGCKLYDWHSHYLSKDQALDAFPLLRAEGLLGAVVYYDAQYDDARMCLALALTAAQHGAYVANHVELLQLVKQDGCCRIAGVRDKLTGDEFQIKSRCVINATGAYTDSVRQLDNRNATHIGAPSCGTLLSLPDYFGCSSYGLLWPALEGDEQTLLMLPWENHTLLGIAERGSCELNKSPQPERHEVQSLLEQARRHLADNVQLGERHVLSAWSGIRPTVNAPSSETMTSEPVLNYLLEVSECNLITLAGGRWNTYRLMAEEAVDAGIDYCGLTPDLRESCTEQLPLDGADEWNCMLPLDLVQDYDIPMDVAQHLANAYGSNAHHLLAESTPRSRLRLNPDLPYIEAEVLHACRHEYACTLIDVIARRLRVAFLDAAAALQMLPRILEIMAKSKGWEEEQQKLQFMLAQQFLNQQMGLGTIVKPKPKPKYKPKGHGIAPTVADSKRLEGRSYSKQPPTLMAAAMEAIVPTALTEMQRERYMLEQVQLNLERNKQLPVVANTQPKRIAAGNDNSQPPASDFKIESKPADVTTSESEPLPTPSARHNDWRNLFMC